MALLQQTTLINNVRAWLIGATCNGCKNYWRVVARERIFVSVSDREHVLDDMQSDEELSAVVERQAIVAKVLERLTERQRRVLRLHYFDGYTVTEIARVLDITDGYARKLTYVALKRARRAYMLLTSGSDEPRRRRRSIHNNQGVTESPKSLPSWRQPKK